MLNRLRKFLGVLLAAAVGYAFASAFIADVLEDYAHWLGLAWNGYRLRTGSSGTLPLLVAGFFLGQGVFLLLRRAISLSGPVLTAWAERAAAWDASLQIPSKFGLHQYLAECVVWTAKHTPDSTQSVAVFHIVGLDAFNEVHGTRRATALLAQLAEEVRVFAVPPGSWLGATLLARYFPTQRRLAIAPPTRFAARWSGGTFAVGFRGSGLHQALVLARDCAERLRRRLEAAGPEPKLELEVGFAMGPVGTSPSSILDAAEEALAQTDVAVMAIAVDPGDGAVMTAGLRDVRRIDVPMYHVERRVSHEPVPPLGTRLFGLAREWGLPLGCLAIAPLVLGLSGSAGEFARVDGWPAGLEALPVVTAAGVTQVRLRHEALPEQSENGWKLSQLVLSQPDDNGGATLGAQLRLTVTNNADVARSLSLYDFAMLDAEGREIEFVPRSTMRYEGALDGRTLAPGEHWTALLAGNRRDAAIVGIVFRPDHRTRIVARVAP